MYIFISEPGSKKMKSILTSLIFLLGVNSVAQQTYIGSTPADPNIRTALNISQNTTVDFIRWHLYFPRPRKFVLTINYGEGQPNTLGLKNGGTKATIEGTYEIKVKNNITAYTLRTGNNTTVSVKKLNDDLLHLLTSEGRLMVGNGGWNYTLSKKNPSSTKQKLIFNSTIKNLPQNVTIFEGRSPCQEISKEYDFNAPSDCFKLKWLLTLTKDSASAATGTFTLNRTLERAKIIKGKWSMNANAAIKLIPEKGEAILFIAGDENVLFFTDKNGALFSGNENFSYTLNKSKKSS